MNKPSQHFSMEHSFSFDPTYGYDLDALLRVGCPDEPDDFAQFWRDTYAQTIAVSPNVSKRLIKSTDHVDVYEIEFDGLGGFRVGGWMTTPKLHAPVRGLVVGHGYGGRDAPALDLPGPPAVCIFPCARGFHRSARPDLPDNSARHVRHGIDSRETYLHRFCVADLWSAATALIDQFPALAAAPIHYSGGSFGGGIGAMALPWDHRITRAYLDVPSFGNHPLRVTLQCTGSGESIRNLHARQPEILDILRYFDSTLAAKHTTIPVYVSAAVFDPAVPPPGQFAVYNCLPNPKRLFVRKAAHFPWPGEAAESKEIHHELHEWFAEDPALVKW